MQKETITLKPITLKTITPMFLAGADGKTPELRPPSLKGALRFWWRAMNGHLSLEKLKEKEGKIFGNTERRSRVVIRIKKAGLEPNDTSESKEDFIIKSDRVGKYKVPAIDYLAYGLEEQGGARGLERDYIVRNKSFELNLRASDKEVENEVLKALYALARFGGLGANSRNGFGSFVIENTNFEEVYNFEGRSLASYTAFSKDSLLFKTDFCSTPTKAMSLLGMAYHHAKSALKKSEKQYIALPMKGADKELSKLPRHAKPYFLNVREIKKSGNTSYQGQILFLPYNYLQDYRTKSGETIKNLEDRQEGYKGATKAFNDKLSEKMTKCSTLNP